MPFLGLHTVNETKDLIKAKDIGIADVEKARAALSAPPDDTWDSQWSDFKNRYNIAKAAAITEIATTTNPLVSNNYQTVELGYQGILDSLSKTPGTTQPGDFQDLWSRANAASVTPIPDHTAEIQPDSNTTDPDLNLLNNLPSAPTVKSKTAFIIGASIVGTIATIVFLRKIV